MKTIMRLSKNALTTALVASCLLPATQAGNIQPKIRNGTETNTQAWPFMVALMDNKKPNDFNKGQFCGGTLIAKNWVLTAAHCVFKEDYFSGKQLLNPNDIDILVNRSKLTGTGGERIAVERILPHQGYDDQSYENDIALIQLKSPASAAPVELLPEFSDQDNENNYATVLGWGATSERTFWGMTVDAQYPAALQQVALPIVSNAICSQIYKENLPSTQLCAGFVNGRQDACGGDSGGPLVVQNPASKAWRQAGIVSAGLACNGSGSYGLYTRVKSYKNFISDVICPAEAKPLTPTLQASINGASVKLNWGAADGETQYQLLYSQHGEQSWHSLDLNQQTDFSIILPSGSDYDVKIKASKGNCESQGWSNVERVHIL